MTSDKEALRYHAEPTPGKLEIVSTKPCETARDLSLAYSPGVAVPCLEIAEKPDDVYQYTAKGNLVGVITNGTAVLGLGDIGPAASKPVMEGKAVLFKSFANIDVFDLELDCSDPDKFIDAVEALAPTFGGINLEDIKAPECFHIEETLKERLDIPVFHDDQHGTAIIAAAALQNALELVDKKLSEVKLVVSGAGASAIACIRLLKCMGITPANLRLCDSKGVIYKGRVEGMNPHKEEFAVDTNDRSLEDALKDADVFFGLSRGGLLKPEMLKLMGKDPIVFAMANPDPEIEYDVAVQTRDDVIMATGRSDYPNQVNNVLGFPFIFRGALDVRAKSINDEMKLAAVDALARLAKEPVPNSVSKAYGNEQFSFGKDYLIPKPFDARVLYYVSPAVAQAAIKTGVARKEIDIEKYTLKLQGKQNEGRTVLRHFESVAKQSSKKKIAFAEGGNARVLKAALLAQQEGIAEPILLGKHELVQREAEKQELDISNIEVVEPFFDHRYDAMSEYLYNKSKRKGVTPAEAKRACRFEHIYANLLLANGEVDGLISGVDRYFPKMVRPIFRNIGLKEGVTTASGLYIVQAQERLFLFADTAINKEMDAKKLASIALSSAEFARSMDMTPHVAMLSFSNFGSVDHQSPAMVRKAIDLVLEEAPDLEIDGEMQADTAIMEDILETNYPFCRLSKSANVLIFPDMQSGNICYKILQSIGGARVIGPIILGLKAPAYVLPRHADADDIFNMTTVAVAQATLTNCDYQGCSL